LLEQHKTQLGLKLNRSYLKHEIVSTVVFLAVAIGFLCFSLQGSLVLGTSMEPGLVEHEKIMVYKGFYLFHKLERGDVIVLHNPQKPNESLVKRIIGLPGDTIKTDSNHVWVNDVLLNEPYIKAPSNVPLNLVASTWHVPPDQYFVLGDNRASSIEDSRFIGFIPRDYIIGKAGLVYWPLNKIHFIDTYSSVFAKIKPS
jgi:signal peptidase I